MNDGHQNFTEEQRRKLNAPMFYRAYFNSIAIHIMLPLLAVFAVINSAVRWQAVVVWPQYAIVETVLYSLLGLQTLGVMPGDRSQRYLAAQPAAVSAPNPPSQNP